jgi:DNA repair ATPase RecN
LGKTTENREVELPKSEREETLKEAKEYFAAKIDHTKEVKIRMRANYDAIPEKDLHRYSVNVKPFCRIISDVYSNLEELYEIVGEVVVGFIESEAETEKANKQLRHLSSKLRKHEPSLKKLEESFRETDDVFRRNK